MWTELRLELPCSFLWSFDNWEIIYKLFTVLWGIRLVIHTIICWGIIFLRCYKKTTLLNIESGIFLWTKWTNKTVLYFKTYLLFSVERYQNGGLVYATRKCSSVCVCTANNSKIIFSSFECILFSDLIFNKLCIYWNSLLNLIVALCIFVESLQFINQRMHI